MLNRQPRWWEGEGVPISGVPTPFQVDHQLLSLTKSWAKAASGLQGLSPVGAGRAAPTMEGFGCAPRATFVCCSPLQPALLLGSFPFCLSLTACVICDVAAHWY